MCPYEEVNLAGIPLPNIYFDGYIYSYMVKSNPLTVTFICNVASNAWDSFIKRLKGKANFVRKTIKGKAEFDIYLKIGFFSGEEKIVFDAGKRGKAELNTPLKKDTWYNVEASVCDEEVRLSVRESKQV